MSREAHVRFWESAGVRLPRATQLPIERKCARFARAGVYVAPSTLGRSVAAAIDLLASVARLIEEQTRAPGLLGTEPTLRASPCSIPVRPKASATARSGLGPMRAG